MSLKSKFHNKSTRAISSRKLTIVSLNPTHYRIILQINHDRFPRSSSSPWKRLRCRLSSALKLAEDRQIPHHHREGRIRRSVVPELSYGRSARPSCELPLCVQDYFLQRITATLRRGREMRVFRGVRMLYDSSCDDSSTLRSIVTSHSRRHSVNASLAPSLCVIADADLTVGMHACGGRRRAA